MPTVESDDSDETEREAFVEVDPSGRYWRYRELLRAGSVKKVYRAFDQEEGIEVAWNQVKLQNLKGDRKMIEKLFSELRMLKSLKDYNIIALYAVWGDAEKNILNFITEVCNSRILRAYRKKHKHVSLNALKKWSRQILKGLDYLYSHYPCIIHSDLNCSNAFINRNIGKVKIGDFGLATITEDRSAHSVLGTPEFMAPELYDEHYTESIDIYAFGMCVLELVTLEVPYSECDNVVNIYKKVFAGVSPRAMDKVKVHEVKSFHREMPRSASS